jgi:hypothetical protein
LNALLVPFTMYTQPSGQGVVVAASATADVIVEANVSTVVPSIAETTSAKLGTRNLR